MGSSTIRPATINFKAPTTTVARPTLNRSIAPAVNAVRSTPTTTVSQKLKNVVTVRNLATLGLAAAAVGGIYNREKLIDLALQVKEMIAPTPSQGTASTIYNTIKELISTPFSMVSNHSLKTLGSAIVGIAASGVTHSRKKAVGIAATALGTMVGLENYPKTTTAIAGTAGLMYAAARTIAHAIIPSPLRV